MADNSKSRNYEKDSIVIQIIYFLKYNRMGGRWYLYKFTMYLYFVIFIEVFKQNLLIKYKKIEFHHINE